MAEEKCASGYYEQIGDRPGWTKVDGAGGGQKVANCNECADLCSDRPACLSYECSISELKCNLNSGANPTQGAYKDYLFCTAEEKCASGYYEQIGDRPGWTKVDGAGGGQKVANCNECA